MIDLKALTLYDSTHRYFYKGRLLLSVTDVFQKTGMSDFSKVKWDTMEEAKLMGDYVHEIARLVASKDLKKDSVDYRLEGYLKGITRFFKENVRRVISVEKPVCDPYHGYAGQPDLVFESHAKRIVLADWKTPKDEHATWKYQTGAYKNAWDKCYPKQRIQDRLGIMLDGKDSYTPHPYTKAQDFDKFLAMLTTAKVKLEEKITT